MSRLLLTVDFHQRYSDVAGRVDAAIVTVADVYAPARKWAEESSFPVDDEAERCFTIGYLTATIRGLLDALGAPEQGPNIDQRSWLPDDDDDDEAPL